MPVGTPIDVYVTSCAARADLFVNGIRQSNGSTAPEIPKFGSLRWSVPFAPGNLTAVALSADGAVIATRTVLTAGKPLRLRVSIASPYLHGRNSSRIAADGNDVALITVELLDANGIMVPNADVDVTLAVTGPGRVFGTGLRLAILVQLNPHFAVWFHSFAA